MQQVSLTILLSGIALAVVRVDATPDLAHGRRLHTQHCTRCHGAMTGGDGSVLYTREPRLVNSKKALKAQVNHYQSAIQLNWSPADIADVVYYLNQRYYQFGK